MRSFEIPVQEITDLVTSKVYKIKISPDTVDINRVTKMGFGRDPVYSIPRRSLMKIDFEKRLVPKTGNSKGLIEKWDIILEDRENVCRFEMFQCDKYKATRYRDRAYKILRWNPTATDGPIRRK